MPTENEIKDALSKVIDPELGRNLVELNMVRDLRIQDSRVSFTLALTVPTCPLRNQMAENARQALLALPGIDAVEIAFSAMDANERQAVLGSAPQLPSLGHFNQVKNMLAVMSGKGGVGKSSVTALLAASLVRKGYKVGILDADITGPSIPKLFGLPAGGLRGGEAGMLPAISRSGIRIVSTNLLLKEEDMPVIWRGPMISATIQQFWNEALWGRLDYLLVDLPPGTSDAALAVTQNLPLGGVLLVTTPQELAALVVRKAIHMVQQLGIPILGIVENMSYFHCPDNGKDYPIFGPSHAEEIASAAGVTAITRLPIDPQVAALCDAGQVEKVQSPPIDALADQLARAGAAVPPGEKAPPAPPFPRP
ncbi:MAG: Mrp/NBP35 family ATP-binding protein [Chloroflexi bacterium]|nr:Mrp/NBP35 family ATP-binding protein [Chloroflexota bacterium]